MENIQYRESQGAEKSKRGKLKTQENVIDLDEEEEEGGKDEEEEIPDWLWKKGKKTKEEGFGVKQALQRRRNN